MYPEFHKRSRKAGLPPETLVYTGEQATIPPHVQLFSYNATQLQETNGATLEECLPMRLANGITWIHVDGLQDIGLIKNIGKEFNLHNLVLEDILSTDQRSKVDEFDEYVFIVSKLILWDNKKNTFTSKQISIVFGKNFLLSFQENSSAIFLLIQDRLRHAQGRIRKLGSDYLAYILLDAVIDQRFVVLENLGDKIENMEELLINSPTKETTHKLYLLKRQMLSFRKAVWPAREVVNSLMHMDNELITSTVMPYLRDVYDHTVQIVENTEAFRDLLASMLDVYLSSLANRTNEIMKVLTIIATIFIPLTFIVGIYGMNFIYMPELHWRWGYPAVMIFMGIVASIMMVYFKRKKWW